MNEKTLHETALGMVAKGRGILAADESTSTIGKRFDSIKVENTEENRRAYRDMLFSTKEHEKYTSGVIFYEETLFHMLEWLYRETGTRNLCMAGGCALNSLANGKIGSRTPLWLQSSPT